MNREPFITGDIYHVYNHGVEDRNIFDNEKDIERFLENAFFLNTVKANGGMQFVSDRERLYYKKYKIGSETSRQKLVNVVSYCLNPNHFHMILKQLVDGGISEYVKRVIGGYTLYFNQVHKRKGSLFRGTFRSTYVSPGEHLFYLSAYVNLNFKVHDLSGDLLKLARSSWEEYREIEEKGLCGDGKNIVLKHFRNKNEYEKYAKKVLPIMLRKKKDEREYKYLAIE